MIQIRENRPDLVVLEHERYGRFILSKEPDGPWSVTHGTHSLGQESRFPDARSLVTSYVQSRDRHPARRQV